jgi:cytochrome c-type biogenesis protein CcmH/NrfG
MIFWVGAIVLRSNLGILDTGALWGPGKNRGSRISMESSEKKYNDRQVNRGDRIKQIFALVSMVSFGGSAIFGLVNLFGSGLSGQHQQKQATPVVSQESLLVAKERGYETVLQREPENQTALEGLANVRLEMNDKVRAIEPLEKLVKLHPGRSDYKALLGQAKGK